MDDINDRLRQAMRQVAILSESEVDCAIRCYEMGHNCACEAVAHYTGGGDVRKLIEAARRYLARKDNLARVAG